VSVQGHFCFRLSTDRTHTRSSGWSARFHKWMASHGLVFKSTIYPEWSEQNGRLVGDLGAAAD
jgi:hypothetical protein